MSNRPAESTEGLALLVPVGSSETLRNTVAYAVRTAIDREAAAVHFVAPVEWRDVGAATDPERAEIQDLLDRVAVWADEDIADEELRIETAIVGEDTYLHSPDDFARVLAEYANRYAIDEVVVDPAYRPGGNVPLLQPMEIDLIRRGFTVEEAPVETPVRRQPIVGPGSVAQFGTVFVISFVFYQLLAGFSVFPPSTFDLATGVISAGIVAIGLQRVMLSRPPNLRRLFWQVLRLGLFVPYLVYEIIKSNIYVTYLILHPKLPIDPRSTRMRVALAGGTALTTLANSITLTPGTLTVRTDGRDLYVHTLFGGARDGLFAGSLERAVRFVFYGRGSAAIANPKERDDCEILQEDDE